VSLHVFLPSSLSGNQEPAGSPLATPDPADLVARPSKLQLSDSDEGVVIDLVLEQVCVCCGGAGFMPVTMSETCSTCGATGYEFVDDAVMPCPVCDGTCWVPIEEMEQCERCDGTGMELTTAGRRLLRRGSSNLWAFLNRWHKREGTAMTAPGEDA
jgi:DnaJ-class molecular chaperone